MNRKEEAVEACKKTFLVVGLNDVVQAMDRADTDCAVETAARMMADIYQYHYTSPYDIATLFIHAGNKEDAILWLGKAFKEIDLKLHFIDVDPDWLSIKDDPRFIKYLKTIGLRK
jgi:hypothetical protein